MISLSCFDLIFQEVHTLDEFAPDHSIEKLKYYACKIVARGKYK